MLIEQMLKKIEILL